MSIQIKQYLKLFTQVTTWILSSMLGSASILNYSPPLRSIDVSVGANYVSFSVYDPVRNTWQTSTVGDINRNITNITNNTGIVAWTAGNTVYYNVYDPIDGMWKCGSTGDIVGQIENFHVAGGVVAWTAQNNADYSVYDFQQGTWKFGSKGDIAGEITNFTVAGGIVAWKAANHVDYSLYDPRLATWKFGSTGDIVGVVTDFTVIDGIVAWHADNHVDYNVYDFLQGAWKSGSTGDIARAITNFSVAGGVVAWTADNHADYSVYDPIQGEWKHGSTGNLSPNPSGLSVSNNGSVTWACGSQIYTRGYNYVSKSWYSGPTIPLSCFVLSRNSGNTPLFIWIADMSIGGDAWSWSFGDGQVSGQRSGYHIYNTVGHFPVTQRLTGPGGSAETTQSIDSSAIPSVSTGTAVNLTETAAVLCGTVNANGSSTTVQFEYGLTTEYQNTASVIISPNSGFTTQSISANIIGLQEGQVYHYRLTATNSNGSSTGEDMTFMTPTSYNYTVSNNSATITGYNGPGGALAIPSMIHGHPVTEIEDSAFRYNWNITAITIPDCITVIGETAFSECQTMVSITVAPSNPKYSAIDGVLFNKSKTTLLQCPAGRTGSIIIPAGVTSIGISAFSGCQNLTAITIPTGVTSIGSSAFRGCSRLASMVIPTGVTSIQDFTFESCWGLTSLTLPDDLTDIGNSAFENCPLQNVTIPAQVGRIGAKAFYNTGLTNVTIPASVTNIGTQVFNNCMSLSLITVEVANPNYKSVDGILYDKQLTSIIQFPPAKLVGIFVIPTSVIAIENCAFSNCSNLTDIVIPASVSRIGDMAFSNCDNLTTIMIPAGVLEIGIQAFSYCRRIGSITVDVANVKFRDIDGVLFNKSANVLIQFPAARTGIYDIPSSVTEIAEAAFASNYHLTGITIPSSVTSIANNAFRSCSSITKITVPGSVTSIGDYAFLACTSLSNVDICEGVSSIGQSAFEYCNITSIIIPTTVTDIGSGAFSRCESLLDVYFSGNAPVVQYNAFDRSGLLTLYYVLGTTGWDFELGTTGEGIYNGWGFSQIGLWEPKGPYGYMIGIGATPNVITITGCPASGGTVIIPDAINGLSVAAIQSRALSKCHGPTSFTIPSSVISIGRGAFAGCNVAAIIVAASNAYYSSINGVLYNKLQTTLMVCPGGWTGGLAIPAGVTRIEEYSFYSCDGLTNVTIPKSVNNIRSNAFISCWNLKGVTFMGNAPSMGSSVFGQVAYGFKVFYFSGAVGFTSPIWNGYTTVNMGAATPIATWLVEKTLPHNADLQSDTNGDGVKLLMAYALNLDPRQNLSGSLPEPVIEASQMSLNFYVGSTGVTYAVETSTDMLHWTTEGVIISTPDTNHVRTATVNMTAPHRYMRLVVAH